MYRYFPELHPQLLYQENLFFFIEKLLAAWYCQKLKKIIEYP
jgi:hypothetical protein